MVEPQFPAPFGAAVTSTRVIADLQQSSYPSGMSGDGRSNGVDEELAGTTPTDDDIGERQEKQLTSLARQMSQISRQSSGDHFEDARNPFLECDKDPELNPNSGDFNPRKWLKSTLQIASRDPERYPRRTAGLSFRNLSVYGYGTAADYQMDVANMWLKAAEWIKGVLGYRKSVRIDILRSFEGLVKSGEMLVVLGRPGR